MRCLLLISLVCSLAACAGPEKPLLERIVADCRSDNVVDKAADFRCRRQAAEVHDLSRVDVHGDLIELTFAYLEAVWQRRNEGEVSDVNARLADLAIKMRLYELIQKRGGERRMAAAGAFGDNGRLLLTKSGLNAIDLPKDIEISCGATPTGYRCE